MAKLHRRVPRLSDHHVRLARGALPRIRFALGVALGLLLALPVASAEESEPEVASAGDPGLVHLERLASQLGSDEEGQRRAAYDALIMSEAELLPAVRARLAALVRRRPPPEEAREILNRIRHAAGSERADDDVDIAPGVLEVLREDRSPRVLQMVEPLLLWRALERIGTFEAGRAMYPLLGLDEGVWRWEERRVVSRMGNDVMAAAIAARAHADVEVRRWGIRAMRQLGADEPGIVVPRLEAEQLADVLRAYAMFRLQSAMRIIVSYVDSERRSVRQAARWAIEQYGASAIWILRTEYHAKLGRHANEQWGWRRVARELYAHADAKRMEPVRRAREAGLDAMERGELEAMRGHLDEVLARAPDVENAAPLAEGYAASARDASRDEDAVSAYRRALRLAPEHPDAGQWRAELGYLRAKAAMSRGVLDEAELRAVLAAVPGHVGARRMLAHAAPPATVTPPERPTPWFLGAALLLALAGGSLLRLGARPAATLRAGPAPALEPPLSESDATLPDATLADRAPVDATFADTTLPG